MIKNCYSCKYGCPECHNFSSWEQKTPAQLAIQISKLRHAIEDAQEEIDILEDILAEFKEEIVDGSKEGK